MNRKIFSVSALAGIGCVAAVAQVISAGATAGSGTAVSVVSGSTQAVTGASTAASASYDESRFDRAWYLKQNPDVAAAGMDPWDHFNRFGRWEGRRAYAGAPVWHPDPSASPAIYANAPGCDIEVGTPYDESKFDGAWYLRQYPDVAAARMDPWDHYNRYGRREGRQAYAGAPPWSANPSSTPAVWAPAGATQVRIRFRLTRFKDGTPCERSYSIMGGASWPGSPATVAGVSPVNIGAQAQVMAAGEALSLPVQGSQGELVINVPGDVAARKQPGYFHVWMRSAEYNPIARTEFDVYLGGARPGGSQYEANPLVLPAAPDYSNTLGQPTYNTYFQGDLAADGWTFAPGVQLNGMSGVFTAPSWRTASGKPTGNYTPVTDADGERPLALVLHDHGNDLVGGKRWSAPMISRLLGQGGYGFRRAVMTLPAPMPGTDAAMWGVRHAGGWPPEFDTHEGFVGDPRTYQTVHMPSGLTTSFTPRVDIVGKHEWMEEFGRTTYRLWIDHRLVVEHPNYLPGEVLDTTFSIEGPGGAGGAVDQSQKYDGLSLLLYGLAWWQR